MRRVLITGGVARIGRKISELLASEDYHVIAHFNESKNDALDLKRWAGERGYSLDVVQADLTDEKQLDSLIPIIRDSHGAIDVLVNSAATFEYDNVTSFEMSRFVKHMLVNLYAPIRLAQKFYEQCESDDGVCINILDQKVGNLNPDFFSYTISKSALRAASEMMALAWEGKARVSTVSPGLTLISGKQTTESFSAAWTATPLERGATPEDVARSVNLLISTRSMNGCDILIDGGEHLLRRTRDVAFSVVGTK